MVFNKAQTVLVTGAAGTLGKEVMVLLKRESISCLGLDLVSGPQVDVLIDIRDQQKLISCVAQATAIVHTAALHGRHVDLGLSKKEFIDTNVQGTLNLLEAAVSSGIKKFIYTSSTSVYGSAMVNENQAVWVDENLTPQPRDIYDTTKLTAEHLCRDFSQTKSLNCCVLRVARFMHEPANMIANYRLYRGLDARDGAHAHLQALHSDLSSFEIFNISNKSPFTPHDLYLLKSDPLKVIQKYYPRCGQIYKSKNWSFPDSIDRVYVIDKAQKQLGYQPAYNFNEYIQH